MFKKASKEPQEENPADNAPETAANTEKISFFIFNFLL